MLSRLISEMNLLADAERAKNLQRYFKTGEGDYGEGDVFIGLTMGEVRGLVKKYSGLSLVKIQELLNSGIHEQRMVGVLILVEKFKKSGEEERGNIFNFYLKNAKRINNWDLVDLSAPKIVGKFLLDKKRNVLYPLADSKNLWERRISILGTFAFIDDEDFVDTLRIAEILLGDDEDLIHKAVGWALREVGKKNEEILEDFLKTHYEKIPRTTLRYAIEKFEEKKRKNFLRGEFD